jgi:hypothetical protein
MVLGETMTSRLWDADGVGTRLTAAVHDNASWCEFICAAAGRPGRFDPDAWVNPVRTPSGYPDAITLCRGASAEAILARIDGSAGCSVKDSFADLELGVYGFDVLIDASWLWRPAGPAGGAGRADAGREWHMVADPRELEDWASVHGGGREVFSPAILAAPNVHVLAARDSERQLVAGAIASVGELVVGISNVFEGPGGDGDFAATFRSATDAIADAFPALPIVGYLDLSSVDAARAAGYTMIGPLRVWLNGQPPA